MYLGISWSLDLQEVGRGEGGVSGCRCAYLGGEEEPGARVGLGGWPPESPGLRRVSGKANGPLGKGLPALNAVGVSTHFILTTNLRCGYHYRPPITDEKTEAQRERWLSQDTRQGSGEARI